MTTTVLGHALSGTIGNIRNEKVLMHAKDLVATMYDVAKTTNMNVLKHVDHQFQPHGATCVLLLQESHFAVHTWPEHKAATCDIFCCGQSDLPWAAFQKLREVLQGSILKISETNAQVNGPAEQTPKG